MSRNINHEFGTPTEVAVMPSTSNPPWQKVVGDWSLTLLRYQRKALEEQGLFVVVEDQGWLVWEEPRDKSLHITQFSLIVNPPMASEQVWQVVGMVDIDPWMVDMLPMILKAMTHGRITGQCEWGHRDDR